MCSARSSDIYCTQSIPHAMDKTLRAVTALPWRIGKIQSALRTPFEKGAPPLRHPWPKLLLRALPEPALARGRKKEIIIFPYKRLIREPYVKGLSRHILTRQKKHAGLRYSTVPLTTVPLLPHGGVRFNCFRFSCRLCECPALPAASHMLAAPVCLGHPVGRSHL